MSKFAQTGGVADLHDRQATVTTFLVNVRAVLLKKIHRAQRFRSESITAEIIIEIHNHLKSTSYSSTLTGAGVTV